MFPVDCTSTSGLVCFRAYHYPPKLKTAPALLMNSICSTNRQMQQPQFGPGYPVTSALLYLSPSFKDLFYISKNPRLFAYSTVAQDKAMFERCVWEPEGAVSGRAGSQRLVTISDCSYLIVNRDIKEHQILICSPHCCRKRCGQWGALCRPGRAVTPFPVLQELAKEGTWRSTLWSYCLVKTEQANTRTEDSG